MSEQPQEVEGVLLVRAEDPEAVARRLAALETVGRFDLLAGAPRQIHDVHLDSEGGALAAARVTLRVREQDGRPLLTLKADARRTGMASQRLELEAPWSARALRSALAELRRRGIRVPDPPDTGPEGAGTAEPLAVLAGLGLHPTQDRDTVRIPRAVVEREHRDAGAVAELAIDDVAFGTPAGMVRLLEVEVEAKGPGSMTTVEALLAALAEAFPGELRPWPYGKLVSGRTAGQLLADGRLQGLLDPAGRLLPAATDLLEEILSANSS